MKKQLLIWIFVGLFLVISVSATNYTGYQAFDYLNKTSGNVGTCQYCSSGWTDDSNTCTYTSSGYANCNNGGERITIYQSSATQTYTCAYEVNYSILNSGQRTYLSSNGVDYMVETGARLNNYYQVKSGAVWNDQMAISINKWYRIWLTYNNSNDLYSTKIVDIATPSLNVNTTGLTPTVVADFSVIRFQAQGAESHYYRNISCWNGTWDNEPIAESEDVDVSAPIISNINFTSEGGQNCTSSVCGPTDDTTPTFEITTNENANCRIDDANNNYTIMGGTRNCTSGMGSTSLTCTLGTDDALILDGTDYVYIACKDLYDNENTTTIMIELSNLEQINRNAIVQGIRNILPGAVIKTNQKVFVRYINATQKYGIFDKVAIFGSKRWLFNYLTGSDTFTNIYSIGTTLNVWENNTTSSSQITTAVEAFINSTK